MPKLTRYLQKIFANNSNQVGVFGTGTDKETSKNVETLQSADYEDGWSAAIVTEKNYPIWQEMDGVQYGLSYQLKYLFQNGVPEWLSTETYYTNSYCKFGNDLYYSLQDNNTNHNPSTSPSYWALVHKIPSQSGNSGKYLTTNGTSPSWTDFTGANQALSNLTSDGDDRLHALKSYEDAGELLTDTEGLDDVRKYAHSTFDLSKFTVTGTPTITNDGIASGFSSSNYITGSDVVIGANNDLVIWSPVFNASALPTQLQSQYTVMSIYESSNASNSLQVRLNSSGVISFLWKDNNGADIIRNTEINYSLNKNYQVKAKRIGTTYEIYYKEFEASDWTLVATANNKSFSGTYVLKLGLSLNVNNLPFANGTLDLKQFMVRIGGVPEFSGNKTGVDTYTINGSTVTVPYTLSKTGSKIVDSAYRTQVTNVYNAKGYAPYYTLSENSNNFTLPMGEIYGLMATIIERYQNGTSWYRVWSDGWCEQGGYVATDVNYAREYTVTLLKEFKDTNYYFDRSPYWAIATSTTLSSIYDSGFRTKSTSQISFYMHENTIQYGTEWKACGYIN